MYRSFLRSVAVSALLSDFPLCVRLLFFVVALVVLRSHFRYCAREGSSFFLSFTALEAVFLDN